MSVVVLETLSNEDLERFRLSYATLATVEGRPHTLTLTEEEIRRCYLDHYVLVRSLLDKYDIWGADAVEAKICEYTGCIYTGAEE